MTVSLILKEVLASIRSQPVTGAITTILVSGMIIAIMLTTGRTVGAEQQVLAAIDEEGTRTIVIRAQPEAGLNSDAVTRMRNIAGIEWVGGFSAAIDARNSQLPDGTKTAVRYLYSDDLQSLQLPERIALPQQSAWASKQALEALGMPEASGGIVLTTGANYAVVGELNVPDFLETLEPAVFIPITPEKPETLGTLIVVVDKPELVPVISDTVIPLTGVTDSSKIKIETSETFAQLRTLIEAQLSTFSRGLVLALLAVTGVLLAIIQFGLVIMRRKDYGRRRALGATRSLIISLILLQTALLTVLGICVGTVVSQLLLIASADPPPPLDFIAAVAILTLTTALISAAVPAGFAARREPIRELRVP